MALETGRSDEEETGAEDDGTSRRKLMAAGAATWATASVAGCGGQGTDTPSPSPTATPTPEPANYVVTDEMATAAAFGVSFASSCSPTRLFAPGMKAVWEINVYDPETGKQLKNDTLSSVKVDVDGGPTLDAKWMGDVPEDEHPAPIWEATWDVPSDAETGEWTYTIEVTSEEEADVVTVGRATGSFTVQADEMPDFYVSTETYWEGGPDALPEGTNGFVGTCAPEREFFPSMDPTFYVQIYETETGKLVGTEAENNGKVANVSGTTVESVTVSFPDGPFDPVDLEWMNGFDDEHTAPHWVGTLTDPETLPTGSYTWQIDIAGVDEKKDVEIVGAAADVFNVIENK